MPNTKLTKEKWVNHWQYHRFIYLLIFLLTALGGDMLFQMTAYRSPAERRVDFELVAEYADAEFFLPVAEAALKAGQAFDSTLEEVNFLSLMYSGASDDVYGTQKFMVTIGANDGHVFFASEEIMKQLVNMGLALPLNDLIDEGYLKPVPDAEIAKVTFRVTEDEALAALGERIYALPIGELYGAMQDALHYDVRDKYAIILTYVKNPETTAVVLQSVMDQLTAPAPEWLSGASEEGGA
jgi:hypothetical protein